MKYVFTYIFVILLVVTSHKACAGLDRAREAGFMPHKALYDIKLLSKKESTKFTHISGKMMYEWHSSCEAWISSHRFDMLYEYAEIPSMRIKSDFSSYESFDGKHFNFNSKRMSGDRMLEELRGSADPAQAIYRIPDHLSFNLPEGTLFPMAHTLDVLEKIREGKKFYNITLFDGSDQDGPVAVNSFISGTKPYSPPQEYAANIDKALIESKSWKLRLAFFPLESEESMADYEMSLTFHENGVVSDMTIDYDDFSVEQKLIAIEPLEKNCEQAE